MGYMNEYIARRLSVTDLESELKKLIAGYNKLRSTSTILYVSAIGKAIPTPDLSLTQEDFYIIHDLLKNIKSPTLDFYIETPGGSGEAAEEIVNCLRRKFQNVTFIVTGEAKSAGTIMALSGNDIIMTETGSLGPIDAQIKIGRSVVSAFDYIEWTDARRVEAVKEGRLNSFDATMIAQISPGELSGVYHALKYAEDMVCEWLVKYKFQKWTITETNKKPVTEELKRKTAEKIVGDLINHAKWRSHGRSIKADDLDAMGLRIIKADNDPKLSELIYRIQTVCRLLFTASPIYKIFATETDRVFKKATLASATQTRIPAQAKPEVAEIEVKCTQCGKLYKLYAKFVNDPKIDADFKGKGTLPFPKDNRMRCSCGYEIDLSGIRNNLESQVGKKIVT